MGDKGRAFGVALFAGCVLSLGGLSPLRSLEQGLAPLLQPLEGLVSHWLPAHDAEPLAVLREPAEQAFAAWQRDVRGPVRAASPGRDALLVPVVGRDRERRELQLAVPPGSVEPDAAVCHRGVLIGLVTAVSPDGVLATVSLLGQPQARPVAAEWCVQPEARPVSFLVTGNARGAEGTMSVEAPSSSVRPPANQLAWTRDVSALGDDLPPHLLLGRLAAPAEQPGGGLARASGADLALLPLLDAYAIDLVTVEGEPGAMRGCRHAGARVFTTCRAGRTLRLDAGSGAGLRRGDWVVQDGLFVGVISVISPWSALVDTETLPATLLVMSPAGEVVGCGVLPPSWPAGWQPGRGDLVAAGRLGVGGLVIGTVEGLDDDDGIEIARLPPDLTRPVMAVGP